MATLSGLWFNLSALQQDALILTALLAPVFLLAGLLLRGIEVEGLTRALLWRYRWTNTLFAALMALSVGLGIAVIAQECALRHGAARAADKFDVIVTAPGDKVQALLSVVYLQPSNLPLLSGDVLARLQADTRIDLVAPIAFGDSFDGAPIIGTTAAFVSHLAGGMLAQGRMFATTGEAVAGASVPLPIGTHFAPLHGFLGIGRHTGHSAAGEAPHVHTGSGLEIVGRLPPTGSPWDRALLVPIEAVWLTHSLGGGHSEPAAHALAWSGASQVGAGNPKIGPPFDTDHFPGSPAFVLHSTSLAANYNAQRRYNDARSMAFFPGAVLSELYSILGDVRETLSLMAILTKILVAVGILSGLVALSKLFARRFALLRAIGAPKRFVLAIVWTYAASLIAVGCLAGIAVGWGAASVLSSVVAAYTNIALTPVIGFSELHLVAAFFCLTSLLALIPAWIAYRRNVLDDLRQS